MTLKLHIQRKLDNKKCHFTDEILEVLKKREHLRNPLNRICFPQTWNYNNNLFKLYTLLIVVMGLFIVEANILRSNFNYSISRSCQNNFKKIKTISASRRIRTSSFMLMFNSSKRKSCKFFKRVI